MRNKGLFQNHFAFGIKGVVAGGKTEGCGVGFFQGYGGVLGNTVTVRYEVIVAVEFYRLLGISFTPSLQNQSSTGPLSRASTGFFVQ